MPINRVPAEDRYRVTKVRTIPGTLYILSQTALLMSPVQDSTE
jgi:hypothetical protein